MKRFLFIIALCAGLQFNMSLCSEPETKPEPSYWQTYAPQFMQDMATTTSDYIASWIPQSVKDTVNKWSTRKKLAIAGTILGSLLAIYNREIILKWVSDILTQTPSEILSLKSEFHDTLEQFGTPEWYKQIKGSLFGGEEVGFYTHIKYPWNEEKVEKYATSLREYYREDPEKTLNEVHQWLDRYEKGKSYLQYDPMSTGYMRAVYLFLSQPFIQKNPTK